MNNHVCNVLDMLEEKYHFDKWDSYYCKIFEVYEVILICPVCKKKSIWIEYRYYKNDMEYEIYDSELTWEEKI